MTFQILKWEYGNFIFLHSTWNWLENNFWAKQFDLNLTEFNNFEWVQPKLELNQPLSNNNLTFIRHKKVLTLANLSLITVLGLNPTITMIGAFVYTSENIFMKMTTLPIPNDVSLSRLCMIIIWILQYFFQLEQMKHKMLIMNVKWFWGSTLWCRLLTLPCGSIIIKVSFILSQPAGQQPLQHTGHLGLMVHWVTTKGANFSNRQTNQIEPWLHRDTLFACRFHFFGT